VVGVEENEEIDITNSTVQCAEAEIGTDRMIELREGESPTIQESIVLIECYIDNQ
jgi:hypothetical protein